MAVLSKKDQKIMDRLKASGYVGRDIQRDARFTFIVRPFTTVGVEKANLAPQFEDEIFAAIRELQLESPIAGLAIFPTIFDGIIAPPPRDHVKYKKGENVVFIGLQIDFPSWASAAEQEKLGLLAKNIRDSIERVPEKYLSNSDRATLLDVVGQVHKQLVGRLLH
jgi:hypothetical protein